MVLFLVVIPGCQHVNNKSTGSVEKKVNSLLGKKLVFPSPVKYFKEGREIDISGEAGWNLFQGKKIITLLNGDCYSCLDLLYKWEIWLESIRVDEPPELIVIVITGDIKYFEKVILPDIPFNLNLLIDIEKNFLSVNGLESFDERFQTFFMDEINTIRLVGNPLIGSQINDLYRDFISSDP